ncbi:unnamed protein product [Leptidea sinapis]|uniref:MADF domain-containing protein n=1 Tax=Leptidea sinapis TaxID=189913 RepID=A0A5E4QAT3_9NEOP|nr:unnamed protein product [Leptidea sinapis]
MVRSKDGEGGIKSSHIVSEVQKRPCLFDSNDCNYGDRAEKIRCWEEVCESVVPSWSSLPETEKISAEKNVDPTPEEFWKHVSSIKKGDQSPMFPLLCEFIFRKTFKKVITISASVSEVFLVEVVSSGQVEGQPDNETSDEAGL